MTKHKSRMLEIGKYAEPPYGTFARKAFDEWIKNNPPPASTKREIKNRFKKAVAIITAQIENGAGFLLDNLLRYFLQEYNDRNFNYGLRSMPSSFNIMEAFFIYNPEYNYFRLRDETDHIMSFVEFLDYFTSKAANEDTKDVINYLEEGVIYSYNAINDPDEITFSIDNGAEFGIAGVSLVRFLSEINVFLLVGEKIDIKSKSKEIQEIAKDDITYTAIPGREKMMPADNRKREAVPLPNNNNFWQTIVLSRFDLEDMTQSRRYILRDWGDCFITITDDMDAFLDHVTGDFIKPEFEKTLEELTNQIEQHKTVFELCKTALHLPMYFENHGDLNSRRKASNKII